ncbi:hypothetical protein ES705_06400 [subsurface metagenome]
MKFNGYLFIFAFLALAALAFMTGQFINQRRNNIRLEQNIVDIATGMESLQDSMAAKVGVLRLDIDEVKKAFPDLKEELKREFDIKLRNAELFSKTVTEHTRDFVVFVRDSTAVTEITAQRANFVDQWINFSWYRPAGSDSSHVNIVVPDSLIQVVYKERREGFPLGRGWFKKKDLKQQIKSLNPYTVIKYNQAIKIEK